MAELSTLARPYAKAAFAHAREHSALPQWSEQLLTAAAVTADVAMAAVLTNPSLTNEQRAQTLVDVCGDVLGVEVKNFIRSSLLISAWLYCQKFRLSLSYSRLIKRSL